MQENDQRALGTRTRTYTDTHDDIQNVHAYALTILWHADISRIGDRAWLTRLDEGQSVGLSRLEPLFSPPEDDRLARPLTEPKISRRPLALSPHSEGITISVDASLPPIEINGVVVERERLLSTQELLNGVVLLLAGRVVLFLQRRPIHSQPPSFGLVGESAAILQLRQELRVLSGTDLSILIRGESGTGKELVAQALRNHSRRRNAPFLTLNMAAIPVPLAASELFGAKKGAFSGADRELPGAFKQADGGTLFLDEVGETPREIQGLLLRALESGEIQPVGAARSERVDVRLLAATDRDLEAAVQEGTFTNPLLQRLRGIEIQVPPLRDRIEDLGRLFRHFLHQEMKNHGNEERLRYVGVFARPFVPARLIARLALHEWPGNVRELRNEVRQLVAASLDTETLATGQWLPSLPTKKEPAGPSISLAIEPAGVTPTASSYRDPSSLRDEEMLDALAKHDWNVRATAEALGVSRASLYDKMRENPLIRQASELEENEIETAMKLHDGDMAAVARSLKVSKQGLKRRIKSLKQNKERSDYGQTRD